jgi:glycosyltransferase involved in cell wall biosynthesis
MSGEPTPEGTEKRPSRGRIVVVMPAHNAAKTLEDTFRRIPAGYFDEIVVVDDHSGDETTELAKSLNLKAIRHPHNIGYGGTQKTCYMEALRDGAEIVVMLHPDGQYDPAIIPEMIRPIREGRADMVLGARMLVPGSAARGGMPL